MRTTKLAREDDTIQLVSSEFAFIDWIRRRQVPSLRVPLPAGDDLAILNVADERIILVGADQVLDGVHFDSKIHSPTQIGRKAMNRNLSDCAAMASWPMAATVTLALPRGVGEEYAKALYLGIESAGAVFDCPIVGGDTGTWSGPLAISISILAQSGGGGHKPEIYPARDGQTSNLSSVDTDARPMLRRGASVGDRLFVTGPLGGSIFGRHLEFQPRVREARTLAATGKATAMIDLSDGLSRDVGHLCRENGVGVELFADAIPIHSDVLRMTDAHSPLDHALNDGEDYELLFAATQTYAGPGVEIGRFIADADIWLVKDGGRERLAAQGWEHQL